mgnify:CR=1 FL=1
MLRTPPVHCDDQVAESPSESMELASDVKASSTHSQPPVADQEHQGWTDASGDVDWPDPVEELCNDCLRLRNSFAWSSVGG